MDNSFLNMDDSIDSDSSFLNLPASPTRAGSDFSFYGNNSSLFLSSSDQSPPPSPMPLFMTPGPAASQSPAQRKTTLDEAQSPVFLTPGPVKKKKKLEEKMTPRETPASAISSFSSSASTPKMRSPAASSSSKPERKTSIKPMEGTGMKSDQVESVKQMDLPARATPPPAPERKESPLNMTEKETAPTLKEMMEAQTKEMMDTLLAHQSHQEQEGNKLLAKADAIQEEVSAYKEELGHATNRCQDRINLVLRCFSHSK